jgi:hypothetical protein
MNKPTLRTVNITSLKVDFNLNIRQKNNYDLPSIKEQIRQAGRILKPIIIRGEDDTVLSGNRRTLAGQELFAEPDLPSDLKEALSKTQVLVYNGLTPEEELTLVLDHGGEKPISKTEVLEAVWRLDKQFYSEARIISWMFQALADYTDNKRKLAELPTEPKAREAALKKWFHGTVGNYMLAASRMGDFVREQMVLTHLKEDKLLGDRTVQMICSRTRITELSAAKTEDSKAGQWTGQGGPKFDELIAKFKAEDAGDPVTKAKRPTVKELTDKADVFKSAPVKNALLVAAGNADAGKNLAELDDQLFRLNLVMETIAKTVPVMSDGPVKNVFKAMLLEPKVDSHGAAVEEAIKALLP